MDYELIEARGTIIDQFMVLYHQILSSQKKFLINHGVTDITVQDVHILETISLSNKPTVSSLANVTSVTRGKITKGTMSVELKKLEKLGYIEREKSKQDRRVSYFALTPKGEAVMEIHDEFHEALNDKVAKYTSEVDTEVLIKSLDALIGSLDKIK